MKNSIQLKAAMVSITVFLVATTLCARMAASPNARSKETAAVAKVLAGLTAADNTGDLDAVVSHYADDAILLPPNSTQVAGQPAIRAWYEEGLHRFRFEVSFDADEIQVSGDLAFVRGLINGRLVPKGEEAPRTLHEKYIMVLRRQKDGWKISRIIWNASEPSPSAPK